MSGRRLRHGTWEPQRREVVSAENEANDVGASLKSATAQGQSTDCATSDRTQSGSGRPNAAVTS
jgi:hypothetical protein